MESRPRFLDEQLNKQTKIRFAETMNLDQIPTPETDALYNPENGWTGVVPIDHARDLGRCLTVAREALQAVSDAGGNYCDLLTSQEIAEKALTQTEPNQ